MFNLNSFDLFQTLLRIPIVLLSLSVHEAAHGYAAYKLGDRTAYNLGRLSLNPLRHLDPIGAVCMLLFGFGWARPVPINTRYFKKPRRDMAISSLAGPASNLIMAFAAFVIHAYIIRFGTSIAITENGFELAASSNFVYVLELFFYQFFALNIMLAVFNLFPIPPLDGSRILFAVLPDKFYFGFMKYEQFISIGIFVLLFMGLLDAPILFVTRLFTDGFSFITGFLPYL